MKKYILALLGSFIITAQGVTFVNNLSQGVTLAIGATNNKSSLRPNAKVTGDLEYNSFRVTSPHTSSEIQVPDQDATITIDTKGVTVEYNDSSKFTAWQQ